MGVIVMNASKLFSALVGISMLGAVAAANAAEPTVLTEEQLDGITAGQTLELDTTQTFEASNVEADNILLTQSVTLAFED
jgi:hypothetical protein